MITTHTSPRFGGYVRVSSERGRSDDPESYRSIPLQRKRCEGLAAAELGSIAEWYVDEDWSGDRPDRPEYNRLMADALAGRIDGVICATLDRFGRKTGQIILDVEALQEANRRVIFGTPRIDTMDEIAGPLVLGLFAALAGMQQRQIAKTWKGVVDERIAELAPLKVPYGYVRRGENGDGLHTGTLVPDEEPAREGQPSAADVVRRVFGWRAAGWAWSAIHTELNRLKVLTPTQLYAVRGQLRKRTPSDRWTHSAVWNIVRSEAYLGILNFIRRDRKGAVIETIRHEGAWDALITQTMFDDAQHAKPIVRNGRSTGALLKGLIRCAACGSTMRPGMASGKANSRGPIYECGAYSRGCKAWTTVQRGPVDKWVLDQVRALAAERPDVLEAAEANKALDIAMTELAQLRLERKGFMRRYGAEAAAGDEDAIETAAWHDERVATKRREVEKLAAHAQLRDRSTTSLAALDSDDVEEQRLMLGDTIDAVFVEPSGRNTRLPIEERAAIAWSGQAPRRLLSGSGRSVPLRRIDLGMIRRGDVLTDD